MPCKERLVLHLMNTLKTYIIVTILSFFGACKGDRVENNNVQPLKANLSGLETFFEAVHTYPDSIPLYEVLVDTLANRGLFSEAASWCDSAIQHEKIFPAGWFLAKGDLFRMAGVYDSAIQAYKKYLYVFPDDEQILLNLANTYAEKGDSSALGLTKHIDALFNMAETRASTAYINGIYYTTVANFPEARKWYDSAIQLRYNFTEAWMERGYAFYDEGKFEEAKENFFQLTNLNKANAEAWYWMGKSEEAMGNKKNAMDYYARAYSLDRKLTDARRALERLRK